MPEPIAPLFPSDNPVPHAAQKDVSTITPTSVQASLTWTPQQKEYISRCFIRLLIAPVADRQGQVPNTRGNRKRRKPNQ